MKTFKILGIIAVISMLANTTIRILDRVAPKCVICCNNGMKVKDTLATNINQEKIDSTGLVVVHFSITKNNCTAIDTVVIVDCNEICEDENIQESVAPEEPSEEVAIVNTPEPTIKKGVIKKDTQEEVTENVEPKDENLQESVAPEEPCEEEIVDTSAEKTCPKILNYSMVVDKITDSTQVNVYADTSSIVLGQNGFEKKVLNNLYTYTDENGVYTELSLNNNFEGTFGSSLLTEKKEGNDPLLLFKNEVELNKDNSFDLASLNYQYTHQHLESIPARYNTMKAGKGLLIAGPTTAGLVYVSERILRKRPDIVYQDYNGLGLHKAKDPWSLINKADYSPEQLANISKIIDDNASESKREKEHMTWQRINDVVFVASLLETAAGVTLFVIDGKVKKNKFVVTPVGVSYTHTIKSW